MVSPQQKANNDLRNWQALRHLPPAVRLEALDTEMVSPPMTDEQFQIAQSNVAWEMSRVQD